MQPPKPLLASRTVIGSLVMAFMFALQFIGLDNLVEAGELTNAVERTLEAVNITLFIVGFITTIVGRYRARKPIEGVVSSQRSSLVGIFVAPILCFALLASACSPDQLRRTAKTTNAIAEGISIGIDVKRTLHETGAIDLAGELKITSGMLDFNRAATQFAGRAQGFYSLDESAKTDLLRMLDEMGVAAHQLLLDGTLHIKNPERLRQFGIAMSSLTASVRIVRAFVADAEPPGAVVNINTLELEKIYGRALDTLRLNETKLLNDLARLQPVN